MTAAANGLESAFREACGRGAIGGAEMDAHQLDLLRDEQGNLPANVFQLSRQGRTRGPGRPKGAGNKRNQKIAQMICERNGDPVLFMSDVYGMPLDQLVELLRIANGDLQREERMAAVFDQVLGIARSCASIKDMTGTQVEKLTDLVEELADLAKATLSKPGAVAIQALALQLQAAKASAEYVHGKQPVSIQVEGKADMVLLVPGLNAPADAATGELAQLVGKYGVDAIDFENMKILPNLDGEDEEDA